jgi:hypothetical protein
MRKDPGRSTWSRTKAVAAVAAVGVTAAAGTLALTASPAQACPGHGSDMHAHVPLAAE